MNRITHFEIYTDDPKAVQPFYQDVFGWKFQKFDGGPIEYWLVTTGDDKAAGNQWRHHASARRPKLRDAKHDRGRVARYND